MVKDPADGKLKWKSEFHFQLLEESNKQNAPVNVAQLEAALNVFARSHPEITECIVRSDNAGNFHCDYSIRSLFNKTFHQMRVVKYLFNDPGKFLVI